MSTREELDAVAELVEDVRLLKHNEEAITGHLTVERVRVAKLEARIRSDDGAFAHSMEETRVALARVAELEERVAHQRKELRRSAAEQKHRRASDAIMYRGFRSQLNGVKRGHRHTVRVLKNRCTMAWDRVAVFEKRIEHALSTANGRWEEWGGRAESVCEILEGGDPFAAKSVEGGS